jgi:hypothetical protein
MPIIDLDKPKTKSHYLGILKSCETASLERYQTFFKLIAEAVDVMAVEFLHDGIFISWSRFDGIGLSFSDAQSLQYMFSEDMNWSVLPSQFGQKKESIEGLSIKLPLKGEGPYFTNYWNLQKALADAILFRTSKAFPFEVNSQIIRIIRKLVEDAENFFPFIDETGDGLVLWVENYEEGKDDPDPKTILNLQRFYEYLDFSGAILVMVDNLLSDKRQPIHMVEWPHIDENSPAKRILYSKEEKVKICNPDKLKAVATSLEENYRHELEKPPGISEKDFIAGKKITQGGNATDRSVNRLMPQEEDEEEDDDCFSYDGGPSSSYPNTDLELFILKKILLEHKHWDDGGFNAKELSFNNDSLSDICRPIQLMIEDKILYLSANTFPERTGDDKDDGIEDKRGFINWKVVEKLDKNPSKIDAVVGGVNFDIDMQDEVKLKGRLDIAVEEFMNDKVQNPDGFAYGMDKSKLSEALARNKKELDEGKKKWIDENFAIDGASYLYAKQRGIVIDEIAKGNEGEIVMSLNDFRDQNVDVLKTLLALEKENILRIKELQSNAMFDNDGNFIGLWSTKDNPSAKIQILNAPAVDAAKTRTNINKDAPFTSEEKGADKRETIKIASVRLLDRILIINNGQETISFNDKRLGTKEDDMPESKAFKVFKLLWEGRFMTENRAITNKKDAKMFSLTNLMRVSGINTKGALDQQIKRINAQFAKKGLKITIVGDGGQYKMQVVTE